MGVSSGAGDIPCCPTMPSVLARRPPGPDFAALRVAGRDALSLALIETRNRTLQWVAALYAAGADDTPHDDDTAADDGPAPSLVWTLGHLAWFQERWIARKVQRARGDRADPDAPRLAPLLAGVDDAFDPSAVDPRRRSALAGAVLADLGAARDLAVETLELTLDLLDATDDTDDALYGFRLALFHEAMHEERFAERAQSMGLDTGLVARPTTAAARAPLVLPATRWLLGAQAPGFLFDDQQPAHVVALPEFEIDAQAVSWAQYVEFVEDGGYDEPAHWSAAGQAWLARTARRVPRFVDQLRHGVVQRRFGHATRLPLQNAVVHVTCHEAEAWCRWAGRRLPSEVEWEAAANQGASRGFRHGEVREWTATTYRGWPGFVAGPWRDASQPAFGLARSLRGASVATAPALVGTRVRDRADVDRDVGFTGFRSCAA